MKRKLNILVIDDNEALLDDLVAFIGTHLYSDFKRTSYPIEGIQMAYDFLFDFVLIDITQPFHGNQFGGIEIYNSLLNRYGSASLIAYSQFVTDDLIVKYGFHFNFVEQDFDDSQSAQKMLAKISTLQTKQVCLISLNEEYPRARVDLLKECLMTFDLSPVVQYNFDSQTTLELVTDSKLIVISPESPEAFYIVGYAKALGKEVIVLNNQKSAREFREKFSIKSTIPNTSSKNEIKKELERILSFS